jgi:hypothetical protein
MAIGQRPNYDDPGGGWGYDPTGGDPGGYIHPRGTGTTQTNGNGTTVATGADNHTVDISHNYDGTITTTSAGAQGQVSPLKIFVVLGILYFLTR